MKKEDDMKKGKIWLCRLILFAAAVPVLAAGCSRSAEEKAAGEGRIDATSAYESFFGPPPTVKEGTCFAMAGYLPLADRPVHVAPVPVFTFSRERRMELLVERLLSMDPAVLRRLGLTNPFPPGTLLHSLRQEGETVLVDFSSPMSGIDSERSQAILAVVGHSMAQFPGVEKIFVTAAGGPLPGQPTEGYTPVSATVVPPGAPVLLQVALVREKGKTVPNEISVFFDRPVTVHEIRLLDAQGRRVQGDFFRSVFDMAVVIHPANPAAFRVGAPIKVEWDVTDLLGRTGRGEEILTAVDLEHP